MGTYKTEKIFPHDMQDMINLIMDGNTYQDISDYVKNVHVTEHGEHKKHLEATIETPVIPVAFRYGCMLEYQEPDLIVARADKSPFKKFEGTLKFSKMPSGHTKIACAIEYKTGFSPIAAVGAKVLPGQIEANMPEIRDFFAQKLELLPEAPAAQNAQMHEPKAP